MKKRKTSSPPERARYHFSRGRRTWRRKFHDAFLGLGQAMNGQSSYLVHFAAAVGVLVGATLLGNFDIVRWCLLVLCIAMVFGTEIMNTALENLSRAVTLSYDPQIGRALNIASGAVLAVSFGAAVVGVILFVESLCKIFVL